MRRPRQRPLLQRLMLDPTARLIWLWLAWSWALALLGVRDEIAYIEYTPGHGW